VIVTCKKQVPFRWIAFAILPWASFTFNSAVIGTAFVFSAKKFIENPAVLTFILSLPSFVSLVVQPVVSFLSDRIWTRFGRRKPFITASLTGIGICLFLMPLMPNFWSLLAVFILYNACADFNSPMEPLKQEIIPPHERGRATGAMTWCSNLATMTFYFVALGRFDDVTYLDGFPLRGEAAIYWSAALLLIVMALLVALGIRELDQKSTLRGQRLSLHNFVGGLLDRELWPVYMLVVGAACLNFYSGLGTLSNLLYTDQWGYTKQEMGINVAIGGIINLLAIGLLTIFADKLNRMRAYQTLICLSVAMQVAYYCYINFVLPDKRPTLIEIIVFGETISILAILTGLVYTPLVYDYIRRNKMGTFNAGAQIMSRLTTLITLNGVGLFVWGYAVFFQPPAGEMTRVVLRDDRITQSEVLAALHAAAWSYPASARNAPTSATSATSWQADGAVNAQGRCWEIRLRDPDSAALADQCEALSAQNDPLLEQEKALQDDIIIRKAKNQNTDAEAKEAGEVQAQIDQLSGKIDGLTAELKNRAGNFHDQVIKALGNRMITEGDEIEGSKPEQAFLLDLPAGHHPEARKVEKITAKLRAERPDVIDLRPLKRDHGYGVTVSALLPPGSDEAAFARDLQTVTDRIADSVDSGLLAPADAPLGHAVRPALNLNLMVLENPIPTYVSPITRIVNAVLGWFGDGPDPHRRLDAIAREMRTPGGLDHVRVEAGPGSKTLAVTVVLAPTASPAVDASLLSRIESAAASQRITIAHPSLASAYAPMRYDYMSGYLWMFVMAGIGIFITIAFSHFEARGLIKKRGVEEAQDS